MKKTILFALLASSTATLAFVGCSSTNSSTAGDGGSDSSMTGDSTTGDDSGSPTDSGNPSETSTGDTGTDGATPPPAPPTLGAQIDRMGRPAINTALNHTFDPACTNSMGGLGTSCPPKDAYNQDPGPATNWSVPPNPDGGAVPGYFSQFFQNLAIYDGLDAVCGNQAGFGGFSAPAYSALATVLSQDALFVNTSNTTCGQYLAVELNALGVTNADCGGRTLSENTIDVTYSLLSGDFSVSDAGVPAFPVTNGITMPASAPSMTFPYFATHH